MDAGYDHAPRAARDVRELGIPLETFQVKNSEGKYIAGYKFGDLSNINASKSRGRTTFSKKSKEELYDLCEEKCQICNQNFEIRYLQVDHKIPYELGGDTYEEIRNVKDYLLLCGSCNRAKSWSCEHCENWLYQKKPDLCLSCYWGNPSEYTHIEMNDFRRVGISWEGKETRVFEILSNEAKENGKTASELIKNILSQYTTGIINKRESTTPP